MTNTPLHKWLVSFGLEPGQADVLAAMIMGMTDREVAELVGLSERGVRQRLSRGARKLGIAPHRRALLRFLWEQLGQDDEPERIGLVDARAAEPTTSFVISRFSSPLG